MGTDIHAWVEAKDKKGKWFTINPRYVDLDDMNQLAPIGEYEIARSYLLFAALANVRNSWSIPFIQENRGLPQNISKETREEFEEFWRDGDSHNCGYVLPEELELYAIKNRHSDHEKIKEAAERIEKFYYELISLSREIVSQRTGKSLNIDDIRIVFWFDN
ncbi:hypothetical protein ACVRWL_04470 [Streptococcus ratti]|uniref:Uncharacterized protein n=1 Tax=Streptococcus ratti TaxID=1341 RepID=A0A7X9QGR7_STRRT|nr:MULTISPECIES: hypothetical protein [Streptococcus]NMD48762.1 hypothetical protein [Streptococcus ratti]